jgi:hypothetical protein
VSNKIYAKLDQEIVCAMINGVGLCVGKLNKIEDEVPSLKKPRAVQVQVAKQGNQMRLGEMIGSPEELFMLSKPVFIYKVMDKTIKEAYIQATSGIVVPSVIVK